MEPAVNQIAFDAAAAAMQQAHEQGATWQQLCAIVHMFNTPAARAGARHALVTLVGKGTLH